MCHGALSNSAGGLGEGCSSRGSTGGRDDDAAISCAQGSGGRGARVLGVVQVCCQDSVDVLAAAWEMKVSMGRSLVWRRKWLTVVCWVAGAG